MTVCPVCGAAYPVAGGFCPMDGSQLLPRGPQPRPAAAVAAPAQPSDPMIGRVLDQRYRVEARIGAGGMGVVYRASHVIIGRELAVKVLRAEHIASADVVRRFLLEAQLASSIRHANVVEISDYGELPEGGAYYVMEFLRGHSLAHEIDHGGRLDPRRALALAIQIARGLGAAHARGIVHRDLKPDNVFLCNGPDGSEMAKILDFGIARVIGRKTRITKMGAVVGTPEYMSPEQAQGADVDHRADLYALGIIAFEMLVGKVPFRGDNVMGTLTKQMFDAPPAMREVEPGLAELPRIEWSINRLLAKHRDERPDSAEDVVRLFKEAAEEDLEDPRIRNKATVAIGSGTIDAAKPRLGGQGVLARGAAPDWPPPVSVAGAIAPAVPPAGPMRRSPSVIIRHGTPAEFLSPSEARRRAHDTGVRYRRPADTPPILLLVASAAVFAALVTVGVVKWVNPRSSSASKGDAPATQPQEVAVPARLDPEPAVASPQAGAPANAAMSSRDVIDGTSPLPSGSADAHATNVGQDPTAAGIVDVPSAKKKPRKTRPASSNGARAPSASSKPTSTPPSANPSTTKPVPPKPSDDPPVSGDLKDPFSQK